MRQSPDVPDGYELTTPGVTIAEGAAYCTGVSPTTPGATARAGRITSIEDPVRDPAEESARAEQAGAITAMAEGA